ncbi:MAG: sugar transferase [Coriobacteriaceae bacterium]|nr:sugar transferase [Olsenella sp.]RRF88974.1 MAG: sugar transferase [Coriobacteriaceae bacterium]
MQDAFAVAQQGTSTDNARKSHAVIVKAHQTAEGHVASRYHLVKDTDSYEAPDPEATRAAERLRTRIGYVAFKRAFDIAFSLLVFALLWWLYIVVAIAIKLDSPGPVLFNQERVGKDGRHFKMYKFRSMYVDAEDRLESLSDLNEKDGPVFKIKDDPRITRVGRFIRKTSLDELPQFLNVLLGNMSVVGPRPALPREVCQYTPYQTQRLLIKPGITCYWQTRRNRDDISFDEWVALDLLYIKCCSAWVDFKLIIQTVGVVLTAQGN